MPNVQSMKELIDQCSPEDRQSIFDHLRSGCVIHPLEREWHAPAEMILDAIAQSTDLTQRGVKGVIADRAFHNLIVPRLTQAGWTSMPIVGDAMYDADLSRDGRRVTVQVKMQRRQNGAPMVRPANGEPHWVVEVQKTRSGQDSEGASTRPYAYGNFDILAVNLYASCNDWSSYVYTVANWLRPRTDERLIEVMQPVSQAPSEFWTADFDEAVDWLERGEQRRLPKFDNRRGKRAMQSSFDL